jgi:hypothetical protein
MGILPREALNAQLYKLAVLVPHGELRFEQSLAGPGSRHGLPDPLTCGKPKSYVTDWRGLKALLMPGNNPILRRGG